MLAANHQPAGKPTGATPLKRIMAVMVDLFCDSFAEVPRRIDDPASTKSPSILRRLTASRSLNSFGHLIGVGLDAPHPSPPRP